MANKYSHAFDGLKREVERLRTAVNEAMEETIPEYLAEERKALKEIGHSSVEKFYEEYNPKYYEDDYLKSKYSGFGRHYDLYNVIEIGEKNKKSNYFRLESDNLDDDHYGNGNKKEIIYSLAFREGKHGGDPWRAPLFRWSHPSSKPVAQGTPILERIQKKVDDTNFQGMLNRIYEKNLDKLL